MRFRFLRILLGVSFCAQVSVFPFLVLYFGHFPLIGFISNLLVEPFIPPIMALSAMLGAWGWIPGVGSLIAFFDYWCLQIVLGIASFFGSFGVWEMSREVGLLTLAGWFTFVAWAFFSSRYDQILGAYENQPR